MVRISLKRPGGRGWFYVHTCSALPDFNDRSAASIMAWTLFVEMPCLYSVGLRQIKPHLVAERGCTPSA